MHSTEQYAKYHGTTDEVSWGRSNISVPSSGSLPGGMDVRTGGSLFQIFWGSCVKGKSWALSLPGGFCAVSSGSLLPPPSRLHPHSRAAPLPLSLP
ncbi:uncharacterized protein [Symphalangus syndactylus]|uniref:uncharacterized protein isoform X2 n=1 Tax=Symphalangus syndactylus TaxID=9590 RepID=UPI00300785C0